MLFSLSLSSFTFYTHKQTQFFPEKFENEFHGDIFLRNDHRDSIVANCKFNTDETFKANLLFIFQVVVFLVDPVMFFIGCAPPPPFSVIGPRLELSIAFSSLCLASFNLGYF